MRDLAILAIVLFNNSNAVVLNRAGYTCPDVSFHPADAIPPDAACRLDPSPAARGDRVPHGRKSVAEGASRWSMPSIHGCRTPSTRAQSVCVGCEALSELDTLVTPDTLMRWYRAGKECFGCTGVSNQCGSGTTQRRRGACKSSSGGGDGAIAYERRCPDKAVVCREAMSAQMSYGSRVRVAQYGRYSSDNQRAASIEDQLRNCGRRAGSEGWTISLTFSDEAMSGADSNRPQYQEMLAAAARREFDILLIDDLSRLSRDQVESDRVIRRLEFLGIRIIAVTDGYDSETKVATRKIQRGVKNLLNEMRLDELREQVHRGSTGQAMKRFRATVRVPAQADSRSIAERCIWKSSADRDGAGDRERTGEGGRRDL